MAVAYKCAIISTNTNPILDILEKDVDALFINSMNDIIIKIDKLLKDSSLYLKMTKYENFKNNPEYSNKRFLNDWDKIIKEYQNRTYIK